MGGQIRIRVRYLDVATPWFDYLFLSSRSFATSSTEPGGTSFACSDGERTYVAVIEKARGS